MKFVDWNEDELKACGAIGRPGAGRACSLTNLVHPLFQRERWPGISSADYELLLPSMRFATRLLDVGTPWLAHFLPTSRIWGRAPQSDDARHDEEHAQPTEIPERNDFLQSEMDETKAELRRLAPCVQWVLNGRMWADEGWMGYTNLGPDLSEPWQAVFPADIRAADAAAAERGDTYRSMTVGIMDELVDVLRTYPAGHEMHIKAVFLIGSIMTHEIAHVVWNLDFRVFPDDDAGTAAGGEPSFGGYDRRELGFCFVARIFGGFFPMLAGLRKPNDSASADAEGGPPTRRHAFLKHLGLALCWEPVHHTPTQHVPEAEQVYAIPVAHMEDRLQQRFWDNLARTNRAKMTFSANATQALKPKIPPRPGCVAAKTELNWTVCDGWVCWKKDFRIAEHNMAFRPYQDISRDDVRAEAAWVGGHHAEGGREGWKYRPKTARPLGWKSVVDVSTPVSGLKIRLPPTPGPSVSPRKVGRKVVLVGTPSPTLPRYVNFTSFSPGGDATPANASPAAPFSSARSRILSNASSSAGARARRSSRTASFSRASGAPARRVSGRRPPLKSKLPSRLKTDLSPGGGSGIRLPSNSPKWNFNGIPSSANKENELSSETDSEPGSSSSEEPEVISTPKLLFQPVAIEIFEDDGVLEEHLITEDRTNGQSWDETPPWIDVVVEYRPMDKIPFADAEEANHSPSLLPKQRKRTRSLALFEESRPGKNKRRQNNNKQPVSVDLGLDDPSIEISEFVRELDSFSEEEVGKMTIRQASELLHTMGASSHEDLKELFHEPGALLVRKPNILAKLRLLLIVDLLEERRESPDSNDPFIESRQRASVADRCYALHEAIKLLHVLDEADLRAFAISRRYPVKETTFWGQDDDASVVQVDRLREMVISEFASTLVSIPIGHASIQRSNTMAHIDLQAYCRCYGLPEWGSRLVLHDRIQRFLDDIRTRTHLSSSNRPSSTSTRTVHVPSWRHAAPGIQIFKFRAAQNGASSILALKNALYMNGDFPPDSILEVRFDSTVLRDDEAITRNRLVVDYATLQLRVSRLSSPARFAVAAAVRAAQEEQEALQREMSLAQRNRRANTVAGRLKAIARQIKRIDQSFESPVPLLSTDSANTSRTLGDIVDDFRAMDDEDAQMDIQPASDGTSPKASSARDQAARRRAGIKAQERPKATTSTHMQLVAGRTLMRKRAKVLSGGDQEADLMALGVFGTGKEPMLPEES